MSDELREFHEELSQEIHRDGDVEGRFYEDAFFEVVTGHLMDAGELDTADRAFYQSSRGMRVDGYGGDPALDEGTLTLIVSDFSQSDRIETLTQTEMSAILKRPVAFLTKALDRTFRLSLEETSAGFGLSELIADRWAITRKVRIFLVSNRVLSAKVDNVPAGEIGGLPITYNVWDLGRLHRFNSSGGGREDLVVELEEHGSPLPALAAHLDEAGYQAYLVVVPGRQLASIYSRWGQRLLEQNVRVFLQARGGVNKGIRHTIDSNAEMFFAYNNGITATAESLECENRKGGLFIKTIRNLQVVNGGQTTASIYDASLRKSPGLDKLFVQMKLSVIPRALAETVVPRISEYANTQNRINAADFFSNHPYHLRLKELADRLYVPSRDGTVRQSKWFYERARGQYQDARANLTAAERKKFDLEYPKRQLFSKTDLAKYLLTWDGRPDLVSKGAQKNFAEFAKEIGKAWEASPDEFNDHYYKSAIAKAIIFRETEALVTAQPWYEGGYRANIVTYSIAKLASDLRATGQVANLEIVWQAQTMPGSFVQALTVAAERVKEVLTDPPGGRFKNVTEWAKQSACWSRIQDLRISWPDGLMELLQTRSAEKARRKDAAKDQKVWNGIEAQTAVLGAGVEFWRVAREWAIDNKCLSEKELGILRVAAMPGALLSDKQAVIAMEALSKLRADGYHVREGSNAR